MSNTPLSNNAKEQLGLVEQQMGELLANPELAATDFQPLIMALNDTLQQVCAELMSDESDQAMAWLDALALTSASLDTLDLPNIDADSVLDRVGGVLLIMAAESVDDFLIPLLDWLQPDGDQSILDLESRLMIERTLLQSSPEVEAPQVDDVPSQSASPVDAEMEKTDADEPSGIQLNDDQLEILGLIASELADMEEQQNELLSTLETDPAITDELVYVFQSVSSRYEHLGNVCEMVSLSGLHAFFTHCQINLEAASVQETWASSLAPLLQQARVNGQKYVQSDLSPKYASTMAALWCDGGWLVPIDDENKSDLLQSLVAPDMGELDDDRAPRQTVATPEDVALKAPDDVNPDLLDSLLQELPDQTAELSASLMSCIKNQFMSDLDAARRVAHTVKGAANVVGIRGVANLTHHMEDMLDFLAKHNQPPSGGMAEMLLAAADCLEGMCEYLLGQAEAPDDSQVVLQQVLDWANLLDSEGKEAIKTMQEGGAVASPKPSHSATTEGESGESSETSDGKKDKTNAPSEADKSLRISYSLIDDLMRLAGEHTILSGQIQEHTGNSLKHMVNVKQRSHYLRSLALELEQLVDVRRVGIQGKKDEALSEMDSLEMEEYNELHTVTHRLVEAVNDVYEHLASIERELHKLNDANVDQGRMNNQQQEAVMQTRMVAVQSVVPRLQRSVRQACRIAGKQVELEVGGAATLIDNDILTSLIDPIMHLLRNSVDHGIEDLETRVDAGKPDVGIITLDFTRRGDQILVTCSDDGGGFNFDRIRQKGLELNLIQEGVDYTEEELAHLILTPGFSTKDSVSQLSGRGVGMDVVNAQVAQLKGVLNVNSQAGKGSQFEIVLPTSLLAAHALLVQASSQTFVVTSHGVDEILYAEAGDITEVGDELVYSTGDNAHKVISLASLLNVPAKALDLNEPHVLMLVETQLGRRVAVLVDQVIASRDIVIKPLGDYLPKIPGVVGATILGDGSAVAVLELSGLARADQGGTASWDGVGDMEQSAVSILVVDDSLSARRSLVQFVQDMGIEVEAAKDGMDALDCIKKKKPSLILADLEMPRMNGLELTTHVRSQSETKDIPVIMITSRATDKHRKLAEEAGVSEYLNKPYSEDQLLQCIHSHLQGAI